MKKLFTLFAILSLSVATYATVPELTKSTPVTLMAADATLSANGSVVNDSITWPAGTIHEGYAKWRVNIVDTFAYKATLDMRSTNDFSFRVSVIDPVSGDTVAKTTSVRTSKNVYTDFDCGTFKMFGLDPGEYDIVITDTLPWSAAKVASLTLKYAGGVTVNIANTLQPADAILSDSAGVVAGSPDYINFKVRGSHKYNDTEWAKWRIHSESGYFTFTINADNPTEGTSHKYTIQVYDPANEASPLVNETSSSSSAAGAYSHTTASVYIAKGDYIVKVWNPTSWSHGNLVNVVATYKGGAIINMPDTLKPVDAILSTRAQLDQTGTVDTLLFTARGSEGHASDANYTIAGSEYVKWKINVTKDGKYKFTVNTRSFSGHNYRLLILNANETVKIDSVQEAANNTYAWTKQDGSADVQLSSNIVDLEVGQYVVMVQNKKDSKGRVMYVAAEYAGGATVDVPGALSTEDAVIVSPADKMKRLENGYIKYGNYANPLEEYAYWKIRVTKACTMDVIIQIELDPERVAESRSPSDHQLYVALYSSLEGERLDSAYEASVTNNTGLITLSRQITTPATGSYYIKVVNHKNYSSAILSHIYIAPTIDDIDEDEINVETVIGANDGNTVNVQLKRSFTGGMYNTICLPFAVNESEMNRVFPGAKVQELTSSSIEDGGFVLNLEFTEVNTLEAGKPYLIWPAANVTNPKFLAVTIDEDLHNSVTTNADFVGNFVQGTISESVDNLFLGADNMLYFPTTDVTIKGMRAYFQVKNPSGPSLIRSARIVTNEEETTDIDIVTLDNETTNTAVRKVLQDGQLYIIRDNAIFNVQGQRVK